MTKTAMLSGTAAYRIDAHHDPNNPLNFCQYQPTNFQVPRLPRHPMSPFEMAIEQ